MVSFDISRYIYAPHWFGFSFSYMLSFYKMVKRKSISAKIGQLVHQNHEQDIPKAIWSDGCWLSTWFLILKKLEEPRSNNKTTQRSTNKTTHRYTHQNTRQKVLLGFHGLPSLLILNITDNVWHLMHVYAPRIHPQSKNLTELETVLTEAWFMFIIQKSLSVYRGRFRIESTKSSNMQGALIKY